MAMSIPELFGLSGRVAIVTGGAAGIGASISEALVAAGAEVVIASRNRERGEATAAALGQDGRRVHYLPLDVASEQSCRSLVPATVDRCGRLDILVNNSGVALSKLPQDTEISEWRRIMDVNLTGAFLLCQAAYPEMRKAGGGKIINIGSIATLLGSALSAAYCASKGGIGQLTKALASAWGQDNIQVNAILPGYIETEMVAKARAERPEFDRRIVDRMPMRRFGRPDELAGAAVFLASPASNFVTGTLIPVDGGYTAQM